MSRAESQGRSVPGGARAADPWTAPGVHDSRPEVGDRDTRTAGDPTGTGRQVHGGGTVVAADLWRVLLDGVDEAVIAIDPDGVVIAANLPANRLLPTLVTGEIAGIGSPLAAALTGSADPFEVEVDGRRVRGRRSRLAGVGTICYLRDVSDQISRTDALLAERGRSTFLADSSRRLGASLHHGRTMRAAAMLAVPLLADCAAVVMPPQRGWLSWLRAEASTDRAGTTTGQAGTTTDQAGTSTDRSGGGEPRRGQAYAGSLRRLPILADVIAGGTVISTDPRIATELTAVDWLLPEGFGSPGAAVVLPLPGNGEIAGALVLARRAGRPAFDAAELDLAVQYANRAGLALAAATLYGEQSRTAAVLQHSLSPPHVTLPGVVLGSAYRPARETLHIGGDFYDVLGQGERDPLVVLGDVCGKGLDAAVLTGQVRQSLHALRQVERRPLPLLHLLNQAMLATGASRFATLVLGTCTSLPDSGLRLTLAGGGHPPPLVLRADGRVDEVVINGMPAGVLSEAEFGQAEVRLAPGETCLLYSDGVTEARGGPTGRDEFGQQRLAGHLGRSAGMPAAALVERVEQLTVDWLDGRDHDDIALLAVQAPYGPRRRADRHLHSVPPPGDGRASTDGRGTA